jgi:hypothetical protein
MDSPGRSTRSRRGTAAGASRNAAVAAEPQEASEDEELSVDNDADVVEEAEGDGEEIEGEIEEAGEAKITKDGQLLGGKIFFFIYLADQIENIR